MSEHGEAVAESRIVSHGGLRRVSQSEAGGRSRVRVTRRLRTVVLI